MSGKSPFVDEQKEAVIENPWRKLNAFTDARVGLGRAGVSIPTKHLLAFQLAHAKAQDAVHHPLDVTGLQQRLAQEPWAPAQGETLNLHSRAANRAVYLQRPDYGRLLNDLSAQRLESHRRDNPAGYDLVIAVVDGLSALAVEQNAVPFLRDLLPQLASETNGQPWKVAPICLVEQGRVAIGDDICERIHARCVLLLVGERPGLSSPDSLGCYLTWNGKVGLTDASRNCISNIRPAGLSYQQASHKALYLLNEARSRKLSGVQLKDRSKGVVIESEGGASSLNDPPRLLTD